MSVDLKTNFIYRDYQLINGVLIKENVNDNKHLMWKYGGVPCLDAIYVCDKFKPYIKQIIVRTIKGRVFQIDAKTFYENKKEINYGFGKQYYVDKHFWKIVDPVKRQKQYQQEAMSKEKTKQAKLL